MSITHRVKRLLVTGLAGAMVFALLPAGTAAADEHIIDPADVNACEGVDALVEAGLISFNDALGFFESNIECMAAFGITVGDDDGNFSSGDPVTRAQMALFIARLASQALSGTTDIPESTDDAFDDIEDSFARDAINFLASTTPPITEGAEGGDSYNPSGTVTREQMASFIARAHLALGADFDAFEVDDERFDDVDAENVHADNINLLAAVGVVGGTGDGTSYSPSAPVTRGQMSAFMVRSIGVLESQDLWNGEFTDEPAAAAASFVDDDDQFVVVNGTATAQVEVLDQFGNPVSGVTVEFAVNAGDFNRNTNAAGIATFAWSVADNSLDTVTATVLGGADAATGDEDVDGGDATDGVIATTPDVYWYESVAATAGGTDEEGLIVFVAEGNWVIIGTGDDGAVLDGSAPFLRLDYTSDDVLVAADGTPVNFATFRATVTSTTPDVIDDYLGVTNYRNSTTGGGVATFTLGDLIAPTVNIDSTNPGNAELVVVGTATDNVEVTGVTCVAYVTADVNQMPVGTCTVAFTAPDFTATAASLTNGPEYTVVVTAEDAAGNEGSLSILGIPTA